jgi:hypothetical protein
MPWASTASSRGSREITVGGSARQYLPNSAGTIFRTPAIVRIRNHEFGLAMPVWRRTDAGPEARLAPSLAHGQERELQRACFSPALSFVYTPNADHVLTREPSAAPCATPRWPTSTFYYNVGRAILLGNVEGQFETGRDSLITIESFNDYRNTPADPVGGTGQLEYFNVDRIRPETGAHRGAGYRGTQWEKFYVDASRYTSWYTDFIGYLIGIDGSFDQVTGFPQAGSRCIAWRPTATSTVRTLGGNLGVNYYRPSG